MNDIIAYEQQIRKRTAAVADYETRVGTTLSSEEVICNFRPALFFTHNLSSFQLSNYLPNPHKFLFLRISYACKFTGCLVRRNNIANTYDLICSGFFIDSQYFVFPSQVYDNKNDWSLLYRVTNAQRIDIYEDTIFFSFVGEPMQVNAYLMYCKVNFTDNEHTNGIDAIPFCDSTCIKNDKKFMEFIKNRPKPSITATRSASSLLYTIEYAHSQYYSGTELEALFTKNYKSGSKYYSPGCMVDVCALVEPHMDEEINIYETDFFVRSTGSIVFDDVCNCLFSYAYFQE